MADEKPLVYLILGAAGSGRREVLADLLEGGIRDGDKPAVLASAEEAPDPADARLGKLVRWTWTPDRTIDAEWPEGAGPIFFVTDGRRNPMDQIEAFKAWVEAGGGEIGRVLCVVNCRLAEAHRQLIAWYDACIHFSDVVLLNRRDGVANKWLSDFRAHYAAMCLPCLFEFVKAGRVGNPALILDPLALRMTHYFDAEKEWIISNEAGEVIDPDDPDAADDDEELTAELLEDPYLALNAGGRRMKEVPDLAKYL
jgi:hypothetical protein